MTKITDNQKRRLEKKLKHAKEIQRRWRSEYPDHEMTPRKLAVLIKEQERFLRQKEKGLTLPTPSKSPEGFIRSVEKAANNPEYRKPSPPKKKIKNKKKRRGKGSYPLMNEILRPFPNGRSKDFLTRIPTDKLPFSMKEYDLYLKSDHWQEFRERYQESDKVQHSCYVCGTDVYDLHHWTYVRLGQEELDDVIPLCREHHKITHKFVKKGFSLRNAHTYVRSRYLRNELDLKVSKIDKSESGEMANTQA